MTNKTNPDKDSRMSQLLYTLGKSYLERQHFQEANDKFGQLLEFTPNDPDICLNLASSRIGLQDVSDNSLEIYERAVALNPDNDVIYTQIADLFRKFNIDTAFATAMVQDSDSPQIEASGAPAEASLDSVEAMKEEAFANIRAELEELWWKEHFDEARKLLNNMREKGNASETATALTEAYEHLAKQKKVNKKATLQLLRDNIPAISPETSLQALRDYLTLKYVLPKEDRRQTPEAPDRDSKEYEFILGMVAMDDFFGKLQGRQNGHEQLPESQDGQDILQNILGIAESEPQNNEPDDEEIEGFMFLQLISSAGQNDVPDRITSLVKTHLSRIPQSKLRRAGTGFVSLAVNPLDQLRDIVRLLRSLESYNAAAGSNAQVKLLCALFISSRHSEEASEFHELLLKGIHLMRVAEQELSVNGSAGRILFAGEEAWKEKLLDADIVMKSDYRLALLPGHELTCFEVAWQRALEDATEARPYLLGDLEVRRCLEQHQGYSTLMARNKQLGRAVIVKALSKAKARHYISDKSKKDSLYDGIRKIGRLNHPNIATLFDMGAHDNTIYYTREYIEGKHFSEKDFTNANWEFEFAEQLLKIIRALAYVHNQGDAHLNLKPANIWLNEAENIKISDFRVKAFCAEDVSNGGWKYQAPEILSGEAGGVRCDIYSLGIICYEILAQKHPYDLANISTPEDITKNSIPELENKELSFHDGWNKIFLKMTAPEPGQRYAELIQVLVDLRTLQLELLPPD